LVWAGTDAALAHSIRAGNLEIIHPWIAAPSPGADQTCAYFKIVNHGAEADTLLWVATPNARNAVLMRSGPSGTFGTVSDGLPIPPGASINVRPRAWCLRLTGLQTSFEAEFGVYNGSLHFDKAGTVVIEFMCHDDPTR
jgi:hypothetical protein